MRESRWSSTEDEYAIERSACFERSSSLGERRREKASEVVFTFDLGQLTLAHFNPPPSLSLHLSHRSLFSMSVLPYPPLHKEAKL